ncbi:ClpP/crotonase-like domain-containing protein, partial [Blyttiomyces helicus]
LLVQTSPAPTAATSPSPSGVILQKRQSVRLFILNRPEALNALNLGMVYNMTPQLEAWQDSDLCKVIVLKNTEGDKAFCAGGDVKNIILQAKSGKLEDVAKSIKFFEEEYRLNHLLGTLNKPFVSIMNGITMGGGVGLSVHAPFRIATEKTLFAMPETSIGLFPDVGGSFFLPRLDGELGTYLGLTGNRLKGEEVFFAGIATHFIPSERIPLLLERLAELETQEIEVVNIAIEDFVGELLCSLDKWRNWSLGGEVAEAIDRCFKFDTIEEIVQALENEKTPWAEKQLATLKSVSPTSLKVTLMQLRKGRQAHFAEAFKMEYQMVKEFLQTPDFYEGVTAKLIDKPARAPKWHPSWEEMNLLEPRTVEQMFFPTREEIQAQPKPDSTYYDYPHRPLSSLPSVDDIRRVIRGMRLQGRTFKLHRVCALFLILTDSRNDSSSTSPPSSNVNTPRQGPARGNSGSAEDEGRSR